MKPGELVRAWVEAFNRADVEALAGLYAEGAVNHQVANEPVLGRAAIHRMFAEEFAKAGMRASLNAFLKLMIGPFLSGGTRLDCGGADFFKCWMIRLSSSAGIGTSCHFWDYLPDRL